MRVPIYTVDAFTDRPFAGNPAGVCILPEPRGEAWMQDVAREMNLCETAFLVRKNQGYDLRWFTPTVEVDLCGHATLASAHILWERGHLSPDATARFQTRSGLLTAVRLGAWIEMDFPAEPPAAESAPAGLEAALGTRAIWAGRNRMDVFVEIASEAALRALKPDFSALGAVETPRGVIVTAQAAAAGCDFVSRFFAPRAGISEDPVTGSAHCALGPYWAAKLGKGALIGYQASARGGWVKVTPAEARVKLGGQAVTMICGELDAG
ncbi:MAG: PhzF family phenazine biosynthesis protein [Planctomycetes bacterium]|nr:PhzF family phenazine biosynthesis protein [Planctomycetota bacterium]